ncbi:lipocalin family protein [Flavobacterium denitrificans]|uniref:lipocalin family protein n=1 Tax=Flavobacterium denitrificans TaxID=281361 RepID=UPI00041A591B|nr:lipocalin family protein [Flavobacterium denitrificans]
MVKYLTIIILLISISSCQEIQTDKLIGSWKMKDLVDTTGKNIEDRTTFTKDNLLIFELLSNGKTIEKEVANYTLKNNVITVIFKNQILYNLKILRLNNSEMELLNSKDKKAYRYIK